MNRSIWAAIALTLALNVVFLWLGSSPAKGQKPEQPPQWEYKIYVASEVALRGGTEVALRGGAEAEFNRFASEGWEYVDTLVSRPVDQKVAAPLNGATCILFKRPRR